MAEIAISVLHHHVIKAFVYNLNLEKTNNILGGVYPGEISMVNITDTTPFYNYPPAARRFWDVEPYAFFSNENTYNVVDYSRSIYNRFI